MREEGGKGAEQDEARTEDEGSVGGKGGPALFGLGGLKLMD